MIYTLGKDVFAAASFKGLLDISFQTVKHLLYTLVGTSLLCIPREEKTK